MARDKLLLLWRPLLLVGAIALIFSIVRSFDLVEQFDELRSWIASLDAWGPFIFVALFSIGVIATFPTPVMKVGAVVLFGTWKGAVVIVAGNTLGSSLAFIISRYLARDSIARLLSKKAKFRKLDNLTKEYGAAIVAISRLVPFIPFSIQNYGFGLTNVKFQTYVILTLVCMIPNTILYAAGTDIFLKHVENGSVAWIVVMIAGAVLAFVGLAAFIAHRYVRKTE